MSDAGAEAFQGAAAQQRLASGPTVDDAAHAEHLAGDDSGGGAELLLMPQYGAPAYGDVSYGGPVESKEALAQFVEELKKLPLYRSQPSPEEASELRRKRAELTAQCAPAP